MPQLGKVTTQRLWLPSTKDEPNEADRAYVDIKSTLSMGDLLALNECENDTERARVLFVHIIQAWNFTDEDGQPEPIDEDAVEMLDPQDFIFISQWVNDNITDSVKGLSNDEKKTSSSDSTAVTETTSPPII